MSKQDKPRVLCDGAATFQSLSLNEAILPGVNLLNGLVGVLNRFRLGRFACMAEAGTVLFKSTGGTGTRYFKIKSTAVLFQKSFMKRILHYILLIFN